jgi:hypothetical protein
LPRNRPSIASQTTKEEARGSIDDVEDKLKDGSLEPIGDAEANHLPIDVTVVEGAVDRTHEM